MFVTLTMSSLCLGKVLIIFCAAVVTSVVSVWEESFQIFKKTQHSGMECAQEISGLCQYACVVRSWAVLYVCSLVVSGLLTCRCLSELGLTVELDMPCECQNYFCGKPLLCSQQQYIF